MIGEKDIEAELRRLGLARKGWTEVLEEVRTRLPEEEQERFTRLHRNFVGYRSETTASRFYGFVFSRGLHLPINGFRFDRLAAVLGDLLPEIPPGCSILDVGAGAGIIASVVRRLREPVRLAVQDTCAEVRDELRAQGFEVLPHPVPAAPSTNAPGAARDPFDRILCIDSLGEINSDDDGVLARPEAASDPFFGDMLEERYGFARKLEGWKPWLAPAGRILLWEPFAYPEAMAAVGAMLAENGWKAQSHTRSPGRNYLEAWL